MYLAVTGSLGSYQPSDVRPVLDRWLDRLQPTAVLLAGQADLNALVHQMLRARGIIVAGMLMSGPEGCEDMIAQAESVLRVAPASQWHAPGTGSHAEARAEAVGCSVYTLVLTDAGGAVSSNAAAAMRRVERGVLVA